MPWQLLCMWRAWYVVRATQHRCSWLGISKCDLVLLSVAIWSPFSVTALVTLSPCHPVTVSPWLCLGISLAASMTLCTPCSADRCVPVPVSRVLS